MSTGNDKRTDERNFIVKRLLIRSNSFVRATKRLLKRHPDIAESLGKILEQLSEDAFHPKLKTHKLKGVLKNSWASSVNTDIRIIF